MARLSVKITFNETAAIGPGKVRLLELIHETGSISAAGRGLGMAYSRAWKLVNELNTMFAEPLVTAQSGGSHGGAASVTPRGLDVIERYRRIERSIEKHAKADLSALEDAIGTHSRTTT